MVWPGRVRTKTCPLFCSAAYVDVAPCSPLFRSRANVENGGAQDAATGLWFGRVGCEPKPVRFLFCCVRRCCALQSVSSISRSRRKWQCARRRHWLVVWPVRVRTKTCPLFCSAAYVDVAPCSPLVRSRRSRRKWQCARRRHWLVVWPGRVRTKTCPLFLV